MKKGFCLVIAIVLASAALIACGNDSATTQQPIRDTPTVVPTPVPTAVPTPTSTPAPTAVPTSTPTVVPTPTPPPAPAPTATAPAEPTSKMEGDVDLPMDCLLGGVLDDAATVSSCNAQAMLQIESVSFNGEVNLLAVSRAE